MACIVGGGGGGGLICKLDIIHRTLNVNADYGSNLVIGEPTILEKTSSWEDLMRSVHQSRNISIFERYGYEARTCLGKRLWHHMTV